MYTQYTTNMNTYTTVLTQFTTGMLAFADTGAGQWEAVLMGLHHLGYH